MKLLCLVLALLGLVAFASAYEVRRDPCAWGPTYWCKSRTNAQQCRQVQYCRQNFWKSSMKMSVSQDACDLCKLVVSYLDQIMEDNSTEERAKEAVEQLCSILGNFKDECNSLVEQYFDVIWELLENELNPDEVCTRLGLCGNSTIAISGAATAKSTSLKGKKECDDCTKIVETIGEVVNSSMTEEAAKALAEKACDLLGPVAPECRVIVSLFFKDIWKMLSKELTPQEICVQLRLCSRNASTTFVALSKTQFNVECSLCKTLMGEVVKEFVNTSSTKERIESMVEDVCGLLPNEADQQECKTFVKDFFPALWELFMDDLMTPDDICSFLGVCGNTTKTVARRLRRHFTSLLRRAPVKVGDELCDLCKEVDGFIKDYIDGRNASDVKRELEDLCGDLPDDLAAQCKSLIDNYFDIVWAILKTYVDDPNELCQLLGLCNSTANRLPTKVSLTSDVECAVCKDVVQFADEFLARNSTEEEVMDFLEKECGILPSYKDECAQLLKTYGKTIYEMLIKEVDADTICSLIKVCTTGVSVSGELCEVCEEALSLVKSALPQATDTVVKYLTDFCGLMPSAIQDECKDFVKEYGPELIPLIAGLIDPDKDCQMVGLCSKVGVLKFRRRSF